MNIVVGKWHLTVSAGKAFVEGKHPDGTFYGYLGTDGYIWAADGRVLCGMCPSLAHLTGPTNKPWWRFW